ncbi:Uncharacterized protein Fot_19745 [Forsythia ovata]|uniref:Uncharacterized protein n=1 Tax=Forsythia ovata TaxID=205694 RepID=A0ABD1VLX3_9LAMI
MEANSFWAVSMPLHVPAGSVVFGALKLSRLGQKNLIAGGLEVVGKFTGGLEMAYEVVCDFADGRKVVHDFVDGARDRQWFVGSPEIWEMARKVWVDFGSLGWTRLGFLSRG